MLNTNYSEMLFTQEEVDLVKSRIKNKQNKNDEILQKIKFAKEDNELLNKIQREIDSINRKTDIENEQVIQQITELKDKILMYNKGDPEYLKKKQQLQKQLASMESTRAANEEAYEKVQRTYETINLQLNEYKKKYKEISDRVKKLDKKVHLFDDYKKRIPNYSKIILGIENLESQIVLNSYQIKQAAQKIQEQKNRIFQFKNNISDKENNLNNLQNELVTLNDDIHSKELMKKKIYEDLEAFKIEFEKLIIERNKADYDFNSIIDINNQSDIDSLREMTHLREKLFSINNDIQNLPSLIANFEEESEKEINVKKVMENGIQKKINLAFAEVSVKNANSPQLQQNTRNLEMSWKEHDLLLNKVQALEKRLYQAQDLLQRKKMIVEEIRRQVVKKDQKPGIPHLVEFYNEEHLENRRLEMKIIKINRDFEIYQSEHKQFLMELDELGQ